jgi:hypothetical protein
MTDRLWGLLALLLGLYIFFMPRERFRREAERDARRSQMIFSWMSESSVQAAVRQQLVLRWIVPPVFIVVGILTLLGVIELGKR